MIEWSNQQDLESWGTDDVHEEPRDVRGVTRMLTDILSSSTGKMLMQVYELPALERLN